jgi:hypothetical protein
VIWQQLQSAALFAGILVGFFAGVVGFIVGVVGISGRLKSTWAKVVFAFVVLFIALFVIALVGQIAEGRVL